MSHYSKYRDMRSFGEVKEYVEENKASWDKKTAKYVEEIEELKTAIEKTGSEYVEYALKQRLQDVSYYMSKHIEGVKRVFSLLETMGESDTISYGDLLF